MDTITLDIAGEIDNAWTNSGMPENGLRIYGLRRTGNKTMTFLGVPGTNGHNPTYVLSNGKYLHVTGPTLAQWKAEQIALDNAARYEAQAADSAAQAETLPEPHKGWANSNAALFADKASFYRSQAAQIAGR
jgi:hypothetical protein